MKFWIPYFAILTSLPLYAANTVENIKTDEPLILINKKWGLIGTVVKIDKKASMSFKLLDVPSRKAHDNVMRYWDNKKHAIMVNGGYFDHDFLPVGYYKVNGKVINPTLSPKLSGLVGINKFGKISLLTREQAEKLSDSEQAISQAYPTLMQAGPYIIDPDGKQGIYRNNHKRYQRTVIAKTRSGDTLLISTVPISLYNLSRALREELPDIERALNLDGGPSSAFMTSKVTIQNRMPVRSYLVALSDMSKSMEEQK